MNKRLNIFILCLAFFLLCSCDNNEELAPIYQRMEIVEETQNQNLSFGRTEEKNFVEANSSVVVAIRIYNPNNCEILSITINGKKYQKYQFLPISDAENIYIRIKVATRKGDYILNLEEIKYIDEVGILIIPINEENTIELYVSNNEEVILTYDSIVTKESYSLEYKITGIDEEDDYLIKLSLILMGKIVKELELKKLSDNIVLDSLVQNFTYQLIIDCSYDDYKSDDYNTVRVLDTSFKLESSVKISSVIAKESTVDIAITGQDYTNVQYYITDNVQQYESTDGHFENLISDKLYFIKIKYEYHGVESIVSKPVHTLKYELPTMDFNYTASTDSINYDYSINIHNDLQYEINKISFFKDDEWIKDITSNTITGLDEETQYILLFNITYIMDNDIHTMMFSEKVVTKKDCSINSLLVKNTNISKRKDIILEIAFEKDITNIDITEIHINNYVVKNNRITYSDEKTIIVLIPYDQIIDGKLSVQKIVFSLYEYEFTTEMDESILISYQETDTEDIKIDDVKFTNGTDYYVITNNQIYDEEGKEDIVITFVNLQARMVENISLTIYDQSYYESIYELKDKYEVINDYQIKFNINDLVKGQSFRSIYINYVSYKDDLQTQTIFFKKNYIFVELINFEKKEIKTPTDLQNMTEKRRYVLMNDIDMTDFDWKAYDFDGVLEGNEYTINNLKTTMSDIMYCYTISMFKRIQGIIRDLTINNFYFDSSIYPENESDKEFSGGILCVELYFAKLFNVNIEGILLLDAKNGSYGGVCSSARNVVMKNICLDIKARISNKTTINGVSSSCIYSQFENIKNSSYYLLNNGARYVPTNLDYMDCSYINYEEAEYINTQLND